MRRDCPICSAPMKLNSLTGIWGCIYGARCFSRTCYAIKAAT